jgi:hypothetical protein
LAVPYQVQNLVAQQADGNILLTWDASLASTAYQVKRSTDGLNFTNIGSPQTGVEYLDELPTAGTMFYYQIVAQNSDGNAPSSSSAQMIAAQPGEMSLWELRLRSQQTADREDSAFVKNAEWNAFLRLAMYELYDLLITTYESFNIADPAYINTNGTTLLYDLPTGLNYLGNTYAGVSGTPAARFHKLLGVDLGVNTSNNAWVTVNSFDFIDRNAYVYPNSTSTIYGVYNMRYRIVGNKLMLIPTPAGNQQLRLWYAPVLPALLRDTDLTNIGWTGWLRYPIVRAAKYALDKEESDSSKLDAELLFLKKRIEESAPNRDQGQAETISATRRDPVFGGGGFGNGGGSNGGW